MSIKEQIKNVLRPLETLRREKVAEYYLKKQAAHKSNHSKIRIAFIADMPELWDKSELLFEELIKRDDFEIELFVSPSYNEKLQIPEEYGYEWEYFSKRYPDYCRSIFKENGEFIDLTTYDFDYIFYGDPYMGHFPHMFRCYHTVRSHAKLCYMPYGFYGAKFGYDLMATNTDFFKNMYFVFADCDDVADILEGLLPKTTKNGLQHIMRLGYPTLEKFLKDPSYHTCNYKEVLWTPRWSYSDLGGGSHFMEYKDSILSIPEKYPNLHLTLRPHPMLFAHLPQMGKMTESEIEDYKKRIQNVGADLDQHGDANISIKKTDIFITDYSSLIVNFFMTGKPVIYCPMNDGYGKVYTKMLEGIYLAESYEDIERILKELSSGNDYLKQKREEILNSPDFLIYRDSTKNIIDCITNDFKKQNEI